MIYLGPRDSDAAEIVRQAGSGFVIEPDDVDTLIQVIERLRSNPAEASAMGGRGREIAVATYDRRHGTRQWREAVLALLG